MPRAVPNAETLQVRSTWHINSRLGLCSLLDAFLDNPRTAGFAGVWRNDGSNRLIRASWLKINSRSLRRCSVLNRMWGKLWTSPELALSLGGTKNIGSLPTCLLNLCGFLKTVLWLLRIVCRSQDSFVDEHGIAPCLSSTDNDQGLKHTKAESFSDCHFQNSVAYFSWQWCWSAGWIYFQKSSHIISLS